MTRELALVVVVSCACGRLSPCGADVERVSRVRDGDSVVLDDGSVVRYIGIDTPELDACYGDVASWANDALVGGMEVLLTDDARCTDVYGRRLAYLDVGGVDVGAWLLEHGYARLDIISPNTAREDTYATLATEAKGRGVGLWSACR